MEFIKKYFFLLLILLLAASLRFWQLGIIPMGVTHDEMGYIYNAYTISQTGKNVFGERLPFLTWMVPGGFPFLPVPIYFSVPFFWIFGLSATTGRMPAAILGVIDVFFIYLIIKKLFNHNPFALLAALFLAISPWHLHFSRSAYDPNYALFFYLLGITLFLSEIKKNRVPFFSTLSFLFAIFSYRGMSVIAIPLCLLLMWYGIVVSKIKRKQILGFLFCIVILIACFSIVIMKYGKTYTQEALITNDPKMQEDIDSQSREAQAPLFVKRLFLNKPLYIISKVRENYFRSYSPEFLFLYTEPSKIYSIWSRGRIYFFDAILIVLGISYIYSINKKGGIFITGLLLIGGLPGGMGGLPFSARNFFLSAIFPIFTAAGILFIYSNNYLKKYHTLIIVSFIVIYSFLLGSYLFDYYGRYAFYSGEAWAKSLKDMSFYITSQRNKFGKVIVGNTSFGDVVQYAFWTKTPVAELQQSWQLRNGSFNSFTLQNVTFQNTCVNIAQAHSSILLITYSNTCHISALPSKIIKDYEGNNIWDIYIPTHE